MDKIVGSMNRYRDFDRAFSLAIPVVKSRWKRIDRAFHRGEKLPPVSLYKIGGAYFVLDGNHRVSTAHAFEEVRNGPPIRHRPPLLKS